MLYLLVFTLWVTGLPTLFGCQGLNEKMKEQEVETKVRRIVGLISLYLSTWFEMTQLSRVWKSKFRTESICTISVQADWDNILHAGWRFYSLQQFKHKTIESTQMDASALQYSRMSSSNFPLWDQYTFCSWNQDIKQKGCHDVQLTCFTIAAAKSLQEALLKGRKKVDLLGSCTSWQRFRGEVVGRWWSTSTGSHMWSL